VRKTTRKRRSRRRRRRRKRGRRVVLLREKDPEMINNKELLHLEEAFVYRVPRWDI
jgi:hypothetical protein